MKKQIKRFTALLLSAMTVLTFSNCSRKTEVNHPNKLTTSVNNTTKEPTVLDTLMSTIPIDEDLSCGCIEEEESDVDVCLPETTTKKETTTNVTTTISTTEESTKESTTEASTNNIVYNGLSITCSDPNFDISEELRSKIEKTIKNFNSSNVSFSLYDLETGVSIQYNTTEGFNGACIVKPGIVLYLLTAAENNELELTTKLKYPGNLVSGSGYLNGYYNGYQAYTGQEFTLLELMYHTLYYSDNNAYRMLYRYVIDNDLYDEYCALMDHYSINSLKVSKDSMWVRQAKSSDGVNMILALNDFIQSSENGMNVDQKFVNGENLAKNSGSDYLTYGDILYWMMINGKYDYLENYTGITSLTKTGFVSGSGSLSCRNDISLCYAEHPYAVCLLTKYNDENIRKDTVKKLLVDLNDVIEEYHQYLNDNKPLVLR